MFCGELLSSPFSQWCFLFLWSTTLVFAFKPGGHKGDRRRFSGLRFLWSLAKPGVLTPLDPGVFKLFALILISA